MRLILENLSTVVLLLNTELRILYANPAAEMFFSVSLDRMLNRPLNDIILNKEPLDKLQDIVDSGKTLMERELRLIIQQQESIVDLYMSPVTQGKNTEVLLEITPQDRHLKITREEALFSQQQVSRELIRSMAHEVKNPLGGIRGAAQLLEQELELLEGVDLGEYTRIIISEADRLKNLVDRMSGPQNRSNKRWINIHQVCERVRVLMANDKTLAIPLYFDYDPSIPDIYVDEEHIIQALLNLVRNAAQSIHECEDCEDKRVTIKTRVVRHYTIGPNYHRLVLKLDVIDTGPGIKEDILEHIFMPLITGRANGSGLGLSIAQSLLNLNGGLIECESEAGNTVFTILLPIEDKKQLKDTK